MSIYQMRIDKGTIYLLRKRQIAYNMIGKQEKTKQITKKNGIYFGAKNNIMMVYNTRM